MVKSIEELAAGTARLSIPQLLPLEQYVNKFTNRYNSEKAFRNIVHQYMGLSAPSRWMLGIDKVFRPSTYKKETEDLVKKYAIQIREKTQEAIELMSEGKKALVESKNTEKKLENIKKIEEVKYTHLNQFHQVTKKVEEDKELIKEEFDKKAYEIAEKAKIEAERIQQQTDAERIAKEKLQDMVQHSGFLISDDNGNYSFNENVMIKKLEDIYLQEIVGDIEKDTGKTGFIARAKNQYCNLISHWAEMDDFSELSDVDWVDTIINTRERGLRSPQRIEHFIAGKYNNTSKGRMSLDTATIIDISSSMDEDGKFEMAQKTGLATVALMRKLNPKNKTYLAVYNGLVQETDTIDLLRKIQPYNGTNTHLALDWIIEKLKDSGPSIANLLTDGLPNNVDYAVSSAKKFNEYPQIMLRLFLVNGNSESIPIIRKIGKAAGPRTKVLPISRANMGKSMIGDLSDCIKEMKSIDEF